MMFSRSSAVLFASLISFTGGYGCSSKPGTVTQRAGTPEARDGLLDLAQLLQSIHQSGGKLPTSPEDFAQHDVLYPAAGALVQNGTITYLPGATIDPSDAQIKLVAMQAGAESTGGYVLLNSGDVQEMTAAEVYSLPHVGRKN